jgi:hypothetical protein
VLHQKIHYGIVAFILVVVLMTALLAPASYAQKKKLSVQVVNRQAQALAYPEMSVRQSSRDS